MLIYKSLSAHSTFPKTQLSHIINPLTQQTKVTGYWCLFSLYFSAQHFVTASTSFDQTCYHRLCMSTTIYSSPPSLSMSPSLSLLPFSVIYQVQVLLCLKDKFNPVKETNILTLYIFFVSLKQESRGLPILQIYLHITLCLLAL